MKKIFPSRKGACLLFALLAAHFAIASPAFHPEEKTGIPDLIESWQGAKSRLQAEEDASAELSSFELKIRAYTHGDAYRLMRRYEPSLKDHMENLLEAVTNLRKIPVSSESAAEIPPLVERIDSLMISVIGGNLTLVERVNRSYINLIGIILALCSILVCFAVIYRTASRKAMLSERSTLEYSRAIIAAQEDERRKLSRDIHDTVIQDIAGIKLETENLHFDIQKNTDSLNEDFERLISREKECVERLRNICFDLRPPELDYLDLEAATAQLCSDFKKRTGIECAFDADCDIRLDDATAMNVYRIIQESLTNAARHASASAVSVACCNDGNKSLRVSIMDNGIGIPNHKEANAEGAAIKKYGLRGMRERANAIGGTLAIDSAEGKGVTVTLSVPLTRKSMRHYETRR